MNVDNEKATFYLEKYARMLSKFSKLICDKCPDAEYEEIRQILSIKLISIANTYKKGSCKESSYFYKIFERETRSIIRSYYSIKNYPFTNSLDVKSLFAEMDDCDKFDIEDMALAESATENLTPNDYLNEKNLLEVIDEFIASLEGLDKDIFLMHFNGMKVKEISKKTNTDNKIIYRKLQNLKKKLAERIKLID